MTSGDCNVSVPTKRKLVVVVDIQPASSNTYVYDEELSLNLIKEYNDSISEDNEHAVVTDESYTKDIREINDGIVNIKAKYRA